MNADLVIRAQRGDEGAFATIVEAVAERYVTVAHRILHDTQLAEDATQQALVKLWRHLPGLRDPSRFDAWAYRLLVAACYSEARRHRRWRSVLSLGEMDEPAVTVGFGDVLQRDELERALRRIPIEHRAILVLRYYADLSVEQVAAALDIPTGTVKSRLHRAHQALRGALDAEARRAPSGRLTGATR